VRRTMMLRGVGALSVAALAVAALAVAALAACGGGGGKAPARPDTAAVAVTPAAACGLISLQDVQAATGLKLVPGPTSSDLRGYSECEWSLTPGKTDGIVLVVNREGKFSDYATAPGAAPLGGFGDSASWSPTVHQLAVKRDTGTVAVSMLPDSSKKAWAEKIMRTVLERLNGARASAR